MHDFYGFDINLKFNVPNEFELFLYLQLLGQDGHIEISNLI